MEGVLTEQTSDILGDPLGTLLGWERDATLGMAIWVYNTAK